MGSAASMANTATIRTTDGAADVDADPAVFSLLSSCRLCPRACGADRLSGEAGVCGADARLKVARAALHFWEEPCVSGISGSGTVFFSGCPLRCVYCQNRSIALGKAGVEVPIARLARIFLELEEQGARNVNLVTPTHYLPHVLCALPLARKAGFSLPVVYNTSGYESPEALSLLSGSVDVYLTDFKYVDSDTARRYSNAPDYPSVALSAIETMLEQTGAPVFEDARDEEEPARLVRGVVVRHLMLPGRLEESKRAVRLLKERFGNSVLLSLMSQYTPIGELERYPELQARVPFGEYEELLDFADSIGLEEYFWQEAEADDESFIPPFDETGVRGPVV